ncbi:nitroreductase family protein, partial [Nitrospirota bacterium]
MLEDLIRKNRSYRRFHQNGTIPRELLKELVNLARLSASAGNLQPLKFHISNSPEQRNRIFP